MTVKALKNQLMAAIAMTLVAAVALGSSTFAWFAQNNAVTASQMQVTAASADPFLQIKSSTDEDFGITTTTLKKLAEGSKLKLVAPTSITSGTVAWGTATSSSPSDAQGTNNVTAVAPEGLSEYVLADTISFKNASTAIDATDLAIKTVTITSAEGDQMKSAVRVLFVWDDGYAMYDSAGTLIAGKTQIAATLSKAGTVKTVDVYMYYDGTDGNAKNNSAIGIQPISASFEFSIQGAQGHVAGTTTDATPGYTFPTVAP